jgi:uroporphyrin-III C-methyltransferase/precorrin-2 dehydrogenase/sirohydrochlorin ferrochelatase
MSVSRTPSELRPPRMERLARLPLFFALEGKRALVAGGSAGAAWKAELLSAAGAAVDVFSSGLSDEMKSVAAEAPGGEIVLHARDWTEEDFAGASIAIGAFEGDQESARFASVARANGVPVNVVDKPAYCDFAFGSIVNRSPLVIGISTDGAAPVFGQAIRARIEAMIPQGFTRWAEAAKRWRSEVQASGLSFAGRRRFWQLFTARAVTEPNREPDGADYRDLVEHTREEGARVDKGSVTLVGAGPGDPELLTLRAVRALQSADVILIDDLVSPQVLDFARREAKKMLVGKTGRGPSCKQGEINDLMLTLARAGKRVVRLKGGDPLIFGRAGEEVAACEAAGIPVEVVPGISAAQGAAARLGVSLTHRDHARRVQFVTGHARDGRLPADIDWPSIADPAATTAVYMPGKTLAEFVARAAAEGLAPETPAVAVSNATRSDEQMIRTTIGKLPERLAVEPVAGPLLLLIGGVFAENAARAGDKSEATARSA